MAFEKGPIGMDPEPEQPPVMPPLGQQPTNVPVAEVQAIVNELSFQRNMMSDRAANLAVQLQAATARITELEAQLKRRANGEDKLN